MNRKDIITKNHQYHYDKNAKAEFNDGSIVVEEKQQRSLNELYYKLMQMGQLGQAVGRQSQFHGNREEVLSMVNRNEVEPNPNYMEDTTVMEHLQRAKKSFEKIDQAKEILQNKKADEIVKAKFAEKEQEERMAYLDNLMSKGLGRVDTKATN